MGGGFNKKCLGQYLWKLRVFFNIPRSHVICESFTKWSPRAPRAPFHSLSSASTVPPPLIDIELTAPVCIILKASFQPTTLWCRAPQCAKVGLQTVCLGNFPFKFLNCLVLWRFFSVVCLFASFCESDSLFKLRSKIFIFFIVINESGNIVQFWFFSEVFEKKFFWKESL